MWWGLGWGRVYIFTAPNFRLVQTSSLSSCHAVKGMPLGRKENFSSAFLIPRTGNSTQGLPTEHPSPLAFYFETGSHWTAKLPRLISNLRLSCLSLSEYWTYRHFPAHLDCFEFWVQTFSQATDMLSHPILHCWIWSSDAAPSHPPIPGGHLCDSDVQLYWAMECSRLGVLLYFQSRLFLTYDSFVERLRSICIKAAKRSFLR